MPEVSPEPSISTDDPKETPPYIFVVTPLVIFILVGIVASIIQMRRRNRLRAMGMWPPPESYFGTLRGETTTTTRQAPDGSWVQVVVRGGPPPRGRRRTGRNAEGSLAARPEEGLNELGEAPPPYDPKAAKNGLKDVELGELERDVGVDPPGYGAVGVNITGLGTNNPYATRDEVGEASVAVPPPVVTR